MQWIASIGCRNDQNKAKLQKWSKSNDLHRFAFKTINNVEFGPKTFKTTQNYKTHQMQWIASIGCQNDQNKAKLQKWSKSNDLHRFDVKTIKNVELRRKTFKTTQNYKNRSNAMNCIDWMSKQIKTKLNYKSDQNPMTCIDLTSKRSKMLSYVAKHSKQPKTTKPIKCNELHRLDVRTIKTKLNYKSDLNYKTHQMQWIASKLDVKTIKTKLNYKSDQNPMTCIDLTSKRSIMLSLNSKHSNYKSIDRM